MNKDYLELKEYPAVIKELLLLSIDLKHQVELVDSDIRHRKSWLFVYGGITGTNERSRESQITLALKGDPEYNGLKAKFDELDVSLNNVLAELEFRKNQFNVLRIIYHQSEAQREVLNGIVS